MHGVDRIGARATTDVEQPRTTRQIDLSAEATSGAHTDAVGGRVILPCRLDREVVVQTELAWRLRIEQPIGHREPGRHLGAGEVHPGTGVTITPLDEELVAIGGIHDLSTAIGVSVLEQPHGECHRDESLGVQFAHARGLCDRGNRVGAVRDMGEEVEIDRRVEHGRLGVRPGQVLQPGGIHSLFAHLGSVRVRQSWVVR